MNKLLCAAAAAMLLSACDKPAPTAPAASDAPPPAAAPVEPAAAGPAPPPATTQPPAAVEPASPPASAPAADPATDAATNDTIDKLLGNHTRYRDVIDRFQKAVATKDAAAVATLVDYPFDATVDGKRIVVKNAAGFVARYDKIVTPPIAEAIVKQKYADLFVNYKGVMFGNGEAWITGICKDNACKNFDVKVVAIQPAG